MTLRLGRGVAVTALTTLMVAAICPCGAEEQPEPGLVTIKCGGLTAELQRAHAWSLQGIMFEGVEIGTRTGAYGAVACVPAAGGWVGSAHSAGGVERVVDIALIVDGEPVGLEDGAVYACDRAVLVKRSMLDKLQLDATLIFEPEGITENHELTATEDVVVTVLYPFVHCVSAATAEWMAVTTEGEEEAGEFESSDDLQWHEDWEWTAACIPGERTGLLMRITRRPEDAPLLAGYWDRERDHRLYTKLVLDEDPWPEGRRVEAEVVVSCFRAAPGAWQETARERAAELVAGGEPQ
ncbi:MAG: hypothetical protein U9R79_12410 [Armatimonadota bacterium]|nr:hypothetical protein [Armatimonadota bacterium]